MFRGKGRGLSVLLLATRIISIIKDTHISGNGKERKEERERGGSDLLQVNVSLVGEITLEYTYQGKMACLITNEP